MIGKALPTGPWLCWLDDLIQAAQLLELEPGAAYQFFGVDLPSLSKRVQNVNGVAVLPLHNIIEPRQSMQGRFLGWTAGDEFGHVLNSLATDDGVAGIVVDVNSPGGLHRGTPELAAQIQSLRGSKPMTAVANPVAGSAALWLASSFEKFAIMPSGETGGLGSFALHFDHSGELEKHGVEPTVFRSPPGKNDMSPYEPLTDGAAEYQQSFINELTADFVGQVAANRGVTPEHAAAHFGGGRGVTASQALAAGLVDRVATLDAVVGEMAPERPSGSRTADLRRRRAMATPR